MHNGGGAGASPPATSMRTSACHWGGLSCTGRPTRPLGWAAGAHPEDLPNHSNEPWLWAVGAPLPGPRCPASPALLCGPSVLRSPAPPARRRPPLGPPCTSHTAPTAAPAPDQCPPRAARPRFHLGRPGATRHPGFLTPSAAACQVRERRRTSASGAEASGCPSATGMGGAATHIPRFFEARHLGVIDALGKPPSASAVT